MLSAKTLVRMVNLPEQKQGGLPQDQADLPMQDATIQDYKMKILWLGNGCLQHVRRLRPLRPLHNLELDIFSLFQALESFSLERGIMNEDVVPALKTNKPKSLAVIEPFYRTFALHKNPPFLNGHAKLRSRIRNTVAARMLNSYR